MGSPIGKYKMALDIAPHLETHKRIIELAYILGASRVRMFSFFPIAGEDYDTTRERALERLDALCELTPDGIVLCHENEKHIFGETAEACLAIHKAFPRIRAVFDPANFVQCGVDTLHAYELLRPYVDYMHIKDALLDGTIVPAGEGDGNLRTIIASYLENGGEVMTLEPHLQQFTGLSGLENGGHVKMQKVYKDNDESFDAAVAALRRII